MSVLRVQATYNESLVLIGTFFTVPNKAFFPLTSIFWGVPLYDLVTDLTGRL